MTTDFSADLEAIYDRAAERLEGIRAAWETAGMPITCIGSKQQEVQHPLLKALRESELELVRLGRELERRRPGRPEVAQLKAVRGGIGPAPGAKLRAKSK
jgi:hypothetical protein